MATDFSAEKWITALFLLYAHLIYGIAGANQIWLAALLRLAGRGQWKMRDQPVRHFLNDLVVGAVGLNGACVIALRGNTARNVREGRIIKTSTTDRLFAVVLIFFFPLSFRYRNDHEGVLFGYSLELVFTWRANATVQDILKSITMQPFRKEFKSISYCIIITMIHCFVEKYISTVSLPLEVGVFSVQISFEGLV